MEVKVCGAVIKLLRGDITQESTDAIVNAANSRLAGGGGVDGAIHRAGGREIMDECRAIGSCPTGSAVITTAGRLMARYVIHTVAPVYRNGKYGEPRLLKSAYESSLAIATENRLKSVAFPSIGTGAYGYPVKAAARIALSTVVEYMKARKGIALVRFVLFSDSDLETYQAVLKELKEEADFPKD